MHESEERVHDAALLRYAEATYRAVTEQRRRQAAVALGVVLVFGLVTLIAGVQWISVRTQVDELPNDPLIEAFGVSIPDPRPAIERVELRIKAFVWGMVSITSLMLSLLAVGTYLMVRPTPLGPAPATERAPPGDTGPPADV